jgi:hypothetical protein
MIFKQTHSLPTSPNWEKIALITAGIIIIGFIAHDLYKPTKVKIITKSNTEDKTE